MTWDDPVAGLVAVPLWPGTRLLATQRSGNGR